MALPAAKQGALDGRLATLSLPAAGAWGTEARRDALARLEGMGLPGRRDEYWRFTDPGLLNAAEPATAVAFENDEAPLFSAVDRLKLVFVDGVFSPEKSDDIALEGLEIERLSEAMSRDIHWVREVYGVLEAGAHSPVSRPHAALNTAFAQDGICIRATGKVSKPVSLIYLHEDAGSDAILHHVIRVEPGAEMTLLENGPAAARFNKCLEVDVADTGRFNHVRAQGRDHERVAVTHVFARLGAESTFKSFTMTVNGVMTRNEAVIDLTGPDATAHIAGACLGDGAKAAFHHDDTVFVRHRAENCESRQVFKKVLRNGATGVFQGKILVDPGAQKTDGYQISQSLLLDGDSQFLAKPELEIYADDVKCSHGSTSGAIDETGLFYLRSRGIPESEATDLMVIAFLAEAIDEIEDRVLAEDVIERLKGWLARRRRS
jgi:Fe-S cluster assembly protein SufD